MISALYNLSLPVFNEEWHRGIMSSVGGQEDRFATELLDACLVLPLR